MQDLYKNLKKIGESSGCLRCLYKEICSNKTCYPSSLIPSLLLRYIPNKSEGK